MYSNTDITNELIPIEKKYRDHPNIKNLIKHSDLLLNCDRILEAKHFYTEIYQLLPSKKSVIIKIYYLYIRTFAFDKIEQIDRKLLSCPGNKMDLFYLRILYSFSINDADNMIKNIDAIFSCGVINNKEKLNEILILVFEKYKNLKTMIFTISLLRKHHLSLKPNEKVKKIFIAHIITILSRKHQGISHGN